MRRLASLALVWIWLDRRMSRRRIMSSAQMLLCDDATTCVECVERGCLWLTPWQQRTCSGSCSPHTMGSQSLPYGKYNENSFPSGYVNASAVEICSKSDNHLREFELCFSQKDCDSCINTTVEVNGVTACRWFDEYQLCGGGLPLLRDGKSVCAQETTVCNEITSCTACLVEQDKCGWAGGKCMEEKLCRSNPLDDAVCYQYGRFNFFQSIDDVCDSIAIAEADFLHCKEATDCQSCTSTTLLNGTGSCEWCYLSSGGCSDRCEVRGRGTSTCEYGFCTGVSDCDECVGNGCAWHISGACFDSCGLAPDEGSCSMVEKDVLFLSNSSVLCESYQELATQSTFCKEQTTCQECHEKSCFWCALDESCDSGACESTSNEEIGNCDGRTICDDQLSCEVCVEYASCVWTDGKCSAVCRDGTPCLGTSVFPTYTPSELCVRADSNASDETVCAIFQDCDKCTSEGLQTDNASFCQWYRGVDADSSTGYCGSGKSCDDTGLCGSPTCPLVVQTPCIFDEAQSASLFSTGKFNPGSATAVVISAARQNMNSWRTNLLKLLAFALFSGL